MSCSLSVIEWCSLDWIINNMQALLFIMKWLYQWIIITQLHEVFFRSLYHIILISSRTSYFQYEDLLLISLLKSVFTVLLLDTILFCWHFIVVCYVINQWYYLIVWHSQTQPPLKQGWDATKYYADNTLRGKK